MLIGSPRFDTVGDLLNQITSFFGGILDSPVVQLGIRAIALYVVILWLAGAYWAFRDMQLRTANPILPYFAASLVILFTPVFFPFAIVAYRVVRPQEKIGEVYERTLAEEALLAEVEAVKSCPTCARRVNEEWIICPTCRTRLNRVCPNCSRLVGLDWSLCAWCGRDFERAVPGFEAIPAPRQAPRPVPEASFASPRPAPALEASSYRDAAPMASVRQTARESPRDEAGRDEAQHDLPAVQPPYRQPQPPPLPPAAPQAAPQGMAGGSTRLTPGYEPPTERALDRAPQPPTLSRSAPQPATASGTSRPSMLPRPSKDPSKGRSSTDPLPER